MAVEKVVLMITPEFFKMYAKDHVLIFDGRKYFTQKEIRDLKDLGFNFKGVGR